MNTQSTKDRKTDRVLVLKAREGVTTSSTGLVDPRLFKGENKLHAIQDEDKSLWIFKYECGGLPPPLKQSFTNFNLAYKHAEKYFNSRGVDIVEVID